METRFLDAAEESIYERLESVGGDPMKLPRVLQPVILLSTLHAMIDNGGLRYPLENDFPFTPPYSIFTDAYRAIGATEVADRFAKAIAMIPFADPERKADQRLEFMSSLTEDHEFFKLGDAICGDTRVWQLLDDYVREHASEFDLTT